MWLKISLSRGILLLLLSMPFLLFASEKTLLEINSVSQNIHEQYTLKQLKALPQHEMRVKTPWSDKSHTYKGPYLEDLFTLAGVEGNFLTMLALDRYQVSFNFQRIKKYKPILALQVDGELLTIRSKGPIWLMLPLDDHSELSAVFYHDFLVWQLTEIHVDDKDHVKEAL